MKSIITIIFAVIFVGAMQAQTIYTTYVVTGTETWNNSNHPQGVWIQQQLRIENGGSLTIDGVAVMFTQQAEVVIETSGILTAIGASFSPHQSYNYWKGITVKGNPNASQFAIPGNPNPQGILVMNNNSVIEKANMNKAQGGAIIKASDTYFINNNAGFWFDWYFGFYPVEGSPPAPNVSYFRECHFEVNDEYPLPDDLLNMCHCHMLMG